MRRNIGGTAERALEPLTDRQRQVLNLIKRFYEGTQAATGEGLYPSVRFIASRLGLSRIRVRQLIDGLHRKGWLKTSSASGLRCLHELR